MKDKKTQYIQIDPDGTKRYFSDKKMTTYHREDGPAIEWPESWINRGGWKKDDLYCWFINGRSVTKGEHYAHYNPSKAKTIKINGQELIIEKYNALIKNAKKAINAIEELPV